jgi:hypothetical protein
VEAEWRERERERERERGGEREGERENGSVASSRGDECCDLLWFRVKNGECAT